MRRKNLISIYHEQTDGNVKHSVADTGCSQSNLVALRQMHDLKNTLSVNQGLLCLSLKPHSHRNDCTNQIEKATEGGNTGRYTPVSTDGLHRSPSLSNDTKILTNYLICTADEK